MTAEVIPMPGKDPGNVLRRTPHNHEAERALLGAIMLNNRAFERVSDFLLPEHFDEPTHAHIFRAISSAIAMGRAANPVTLQSALPADLVPEGAMRYLTGVLGEAVTIINAGDYGQLIYDLALRRDLIGIGEEMVNQAYDGAWDDPATMIVDGAEERLFALRAEGPRGGLADVGLAADGAIALAEAAHKSGGKLVGITTGLRDLDAKLGGLHVSDLLILAGRPSMGKTALATEIAVAAARSFANPQKEEHRGKVVAFFSLEMSKEQLATRIMAEMANLDSHRIRSGLLRPDEFERLIRAGQDLQALPLKIDDTPAATVAAIRTRCRRLARKGNLGLVVVDYLQLISSGGRERPENRVQEISAITRGLKALAKDLNVPVLALSQLSRALEAREDKRPQLSDLRESGTIEQDSDVVMFVYREQYYLERAEPQQRSDEGQERFNERRDKWSSRLADVVNTAEVILGKQRHGPIGTVRLHFHGPTTHFSDLEQQQDAAPPPRAGVSRGTDNYRSDPPPGHPAAEQSNWDF